MLSMNDIAKKLNVGVKVVQNRFKKYGFTARSKKESGLICGKKLQKGSTLTCPFCGKKFYIKSCHLNGDSKNHFCSSECSNRYYKQKRAKDRKNGKFVNCYTCGKIHYRNKTQLKQKHYFCSRQCFDKFHSSSMRGLNHPNYKAVTMQCPVCNKEISVIQSRLKYKVHYCSKECMAIDYQTRLKGKNNPNYIHGQELYYGKNWADISLKIKNRDHFECQRCHTKENELPANWKLDVHHIIPLRTFNSIEEANQESNLITLCSRCHKIVEHHGIDF